VSLAWDGGFPLLGCSISRSVMLLQQDGGSGAPYFKWQGLSKVTNFLGLIEHAIWLLVKPVFGQEDLLLLAMMNVQEKVRADLSCSSLTLSGMMLKNHFYFWLLCSELAVNLDLLL